MKKLIKKLPIVAFVFAIATAFAFNTAEERSTTWFPVNSQGEIGTTPIPEPDCFQEIMDYCAVEFDNGDLVNGEPPIESVKETGAEQVYLDLTYRE